VLLVWFGRVYHVAVADRPCVSPNRRRRPRLPSRQQQAILVFQRSINTFRYLINKLIVYSDSLILCVASKTHFYFGEWKNAKPPRKSPKLKI
jgi:hypothetical protein